MENIKKGGIRTLAISWLSLMVVLGSVIVILFIGDNNNDWAIRTLSVKNQLTEVLSTIKAAEAGQRGFLLDGEEKYLEPYYNSEEESDSILYLIEESIGDNPLQKKKILELQNLVRNKFNEMDRTLELAKGGDRQSAILIVKKDIGLALMLKIKGIISEMKHEEAQTLKRIRKRSDWLQVFTLILIATSIAIIAFGAYNMNSRTIPLMTELAETKASLDNSVEELKQTNSYLEDAVQETKKEIKMRAKSEREAKFLVKQLKEKNKELNHFAYIASHDLQEPLRTVSNFIALFKEEYDEKLGDSANMYFQFINGATDKMRNLITSLLNYARLGASAQIEEVDLQVLVAEVQMFLVTAIHDNKANITVGNLPTVMAYKTEIAQIIQNLITNALKFTKPGEAPEIKIDATEDETHWRISVSDNGIGISERNQEKIFNIFSKLHSNTEYEGQGIGLAFCKKITDLHEGEIWVESKEGNGSTFNFTISKTLQDEKKVEESTSH